MAIDYAASTQVIASLSTDDGATISVPATVANGDGLILAVLFQTTAHAAPGGVTGWDLRVNGIGANVSLFVYTRVAASEPASYALTWTNERAAVIMARVTDASASPCVFDVVASNTIASGTAHAITGVTAADANTVCVAIWGGDEGAVATYTPTGGAAVTDREHINSTASVPGLMLGTRTQGSGATGTKSATSSVTRTGAGAVMTWYATAGAAGTGALGLAPVSLAGTGSQIDTATGALALAPVSLAGTGAQVQTATGALALPPVSLAGTGVMLPTATGALILPPVALAGTGAQIDTATGGLVLPRVSLAGTGTHGVAASGALLLPPVSLAGTGVEHPTGTGALLVPVVALSGVGVQIDTATGALTLAPVSLAGTGVMQPSATGALLVPAVALAGTGAQVDVATGALLLPPVSLVGTGVQIDTATGSLVLPMVTLAGSGLMVPVGTGALILPRVALSGTGHAPASLGPAYFTTGSDNGTGVAWTNPNNVIAEDATDATATAITSTASGIKAVGPVGVSALADDDIIDGIVYEILCARGAVGTLLDDTVQLLIAGTPTGTNLSAGLAWTANTLTRQTYGTATELWGNVGMTGLTVKNANFGILHKQKRSGATAVDGRIDSMRMTIYYHSAGPAGTSALTLPPVSLSGTGAQIQTATGALTLAPVALSGSGVMVPTGSGAFLLAPVSLAGSGFGPLPIGNGDLLLPALLLSGTGAQPFVAVGGLTLPVVRLDGSGVMPATGIGALRLPAVVLFGSGETESLQGYLVLPAGFAIDSTGKLVAGQAFDSAGLPPAGDAYFRNSPPAGGG